MFKKKKKSLLCKFCHRAVCAMRLTGSPVSKSLGVKGEPDAMARVRVREEGKRGGPWVSVFLGRGACLFYKHRVQISIGAGLLSAIWGGCPPTLEALSKTIVFVAW